MDTYGEYFALRNMAKISEKNPGFSSGVSVVIEKFKKTLELMNEIDSLDMA
jgi:hypothetical protein